MVTLKDIAHMAGVSISTVSRVLNKKDTSVASKEMKDKIWSIVRDTGYIPNKNARELRKASDDNAVLTHHKDKRYFAFIYARSEDNKDMFFSELASSIEYEAYKKGYILKYSFYATDLELSEFNEIIEKYEISGIIVLGRFKKQSVISIAEAQNNVVYVGLNYFSHRHDAVFCDGFKASMKAMETLYNLGHSKIAYIGETDMENRYQGYYRFCEENNIEINPGIIINAHQSLDGGYRGVKQLLSRNQSFTSIFCANDATAMGAIKGLIENGYRIPQDISVISIDDIEMARYFTPMLTTIHIPIGELGKQAARALIDRIENGRIIPIKIELPFSLASRNSCVDKRMSED